MKQQGNLQVWLSLALDICPECGENGLRVENQNYLSAVLTCPKCRAKYWISPIRERGAKKIPS